jgi:hypothetical protein
MITVKLFILKTKILIMSCCGNKRESLQYGFQQSFHQMAIRSNKLGPDVSFEYTGNTELIVKGSVTGISYRFARKGEVQLIDRRDANEMMAIASLREIKS